MLTVLGASEDGYSFSEWRLATGIPRRTFARRLAQLLKDGELVKDPGNNKYSISPANLDIAELEREEDE
jgi:DNA-binding IclR family transcriptional regulator